MTPASNRTLTVRVEILYPRRSVRQYDSHCRGRNSVERDCCLASLSVRGAAVCLLRACQNMRGDLSPSSPYDRKVIKTRSAVGACYWGIGVRRLKPYNIDFVVNSAIPVSHNNRGARITTLCPKNAPGLTSCNLAKN